MDIHIENLTVQQGAQILLTNFAMHIPTGKSVAIVGQSGSGKTTLLRIIAGLKVPEVGTVLIDGAAPSSLYGTSKLAYLFQEAYLWKHLTVKRNLELVYELNRIPIDSPQIKTQLLSVGLEGTHDQFPHELSVGMRARAAIARAMCIPPKILLMDEPFAALDPNRRHELNQKIRSVCQAKTTTAIWVTHDVVEALAFADVIVSLTPGKTAKTFTTENLPPTLDQGALPPSVLLLRDEILSEINSDTKMKLVGSQ